MAFICCRYFNGKRRAEEALLDAYPGSGVILRPGFIYGTRHVHLPVADTSIPLPLWIVGKPLEKLFNLYPVKLAREKLPGVKALLVPPIAVEALAKTAVAVAASDASLINRYVPSNRIMSVESIQSVAE